VTMAGCAGVQGTLPGEPMSVEALHTWLDAQRPAAEQHTGSRRHPTHSAR